MLFDFARTVELAIHFTVPCTRPANCRNLSFAQTYPLGNYRSQIPRRYVLGAREKKNTNNKLKPTWNAVANFCEVGEHYMYTSTARDCIKIFQYPFRTAESGRPVHRSPMVVNFSRQPTCEPRHWPLARVRSFSLNSTDTPKPFRACTSPSVWCAAGISCIAQNERYRQQTSLSLSLSHTHSISVSVTRCENMPQLRASYLCTLHWGIGARLDK